MTLYLRGRSSDGESYQSKTCVCKVSRSRASCTPLCIRYRTSLRMSHPINRSPVLPRDLDLVSVRIAIRFSNTNGEPGFHARMVNASATWLNHSRCSRHLTFGCGNFLEGDFLEKRPRHGFPKRPADSISSAGQATNEY